MASSEFVESLRRFDSHERGLVMQWAAGEPFHVGPALRAAVGGATGTQPPADAFVAMDYTMDWLYAAVRTTLEGVNSSPQLWPAGGELTASQEDIDLLIAWEDQQGPHLVLVEAKGFTGWSNRQMSSKAARLDAIFAGDLRSRFDVHLFLAGPAPSMGLRVDDWPKWTQPGAHTHFLSISDPGVRYAVQRCDARGHPTSRDWTHWTATPRRWQSGTAKEPGLDSAPPQRPSSRTRLCSRCAMASADWLVAARYDDSEPGGRLLVYCERCRHAVAGKLGTVLPLSLLDEDPDGILSLLYRHRATASDPVGAAEAIGVDIGPWADVAREQVDQPNA